MRIVLRSTLALAVATLAMAACSKDTNTAPTTPLLSKADADTLASTVVGDVIDELATSTMDGASGGGLASSPALSAPLAAATTMQCIPAKSPTPVVDADNDGVPDSVRFDYAGCVISFPLQLDSISGTIDLIDPTAATKDHSVKRVFTDFKRVTMLLISGDEMSITRNGVRQSSRDTTVLHSSETNFRTDFVGPKGGTWEHERTWESIFTADVVGSIQPNTLLPSGTWSVNGTSSWTRPKGTYSLTVTTNPALHYNASCTNAPRFDAGKITAVVMKNSQTMTVTIEFTACGQYTVTRS